jgi:hypothetical protein
VTWGLTQLQLAWTLDSARSLQTSMIAPQAQTYGLNRQLVLGSVATPQPVAVVAPLGRDIGGATHDTEVRPIDELPGRGPQPSDMGHELSHSQ